MMQSLPEDVKEAINSVDSLDVILGIEKKYKLHFDQTGQLSDEILMLTIGITPPQQFISNIQKRMGVSKEVAQEIGAEVNEKIFKPIRDSLKQIHNIKTRMEDAKNEVPPVTETPVIEEPKAEEPAFPKEMPVLEEKAPEIQKPPEESAPPLKESPIFAQEPEPLPEKMPEIPPQAPAEPKPEMKNIAETKLEKPFNIASKTTVDPYREPIA
jgi:ribosomal protein L12E/L44/L45/RPP1/RPP2